MSLQSVNPATGKVFKTYPETSSAEIAAALQKSGRAFESWRRIPFSEKSKLMKAASAVLRKKSESLSKLMAEEMGKPLTQGRKEIEKCAACCDFYAENAEKFLSPEIIKTDASKSYAAFEPLGAVLAIMPWNFPFWQVFRAAAPALMAGNVMVLKHASNVSGCSVEIEKIFLEAGFPPGVFTNVLADIPAVAPMIEHPAIKAVTLTGSVRAGKAVASKTGSVLKKSVLELGGSDAYVILEDADLKQAVTACGESRMINSGQSCIAAKRFIVVESLYEKFAQGLVEFMRGMRMGEPLDEKTAVGPMARHDLRDGLHDQVRQSVKKGAEILTGGEIPEGPGAFYPPTVLGNVKKGMPAFDEELFGPVASIIKVKDEKEAIAAANDSVFGLGSAVFTQDVKRGERIAREELQAGSAFVNSFVRSDMRLPFGGIGESGYGRELGIFGIREFVNIKTVYIQ